MKISNIIAAVAVAFVANVAHAEPMQAKVGYADLNLASAEGQARLARRIDAAAKAVCGVNSNERLLSISMSTQRCHQNAVARTNLAIASANAPVLASR
jgi:UrcA family protein